MTRRSRGSRGSRQVRTRRIGLLRRPRPRVGVEQRLWLFLPPLFGVGPLLLFLLFPDGRPRTRRWRPAIWLAVAATAAMSFATAFSPGPLEEAPVKGSPPVEGLVMLGQPR